MKFACLLFIAFAPVVPAADPAPGDADLPQPFEQGAAQDLLANSPFTRSLNISDSLRLTGIAYVDGHPVATFLNKTTRESFVVSEEPNSQGMKLAETSASTELRRTQVKLMVGGETVVVRYSDEQLDPKSKHPGGPADASFAGGSSSNPQHVKTSSYLGENGRELYASLSDKSREKFKEIIRGRFESHPEYTEDQRAAYAQKVFTSILASDQKAAAAGADPADGVAPVKAPKPSKSLKAPR
jgi:hypothetical protein